MGELHQDLFLSNFPLKRSVGAILSAVSLHVYRLVGAYPHYIEREVCLDGIRIAVENTTQYEAIKQCNGMYVFNQPIWIIEFPSHYGRHMNALKEIFDIYTSNGMLDLSNLMLKYAEIDQLNPFRQPLKDGEERPELMIEVSFDNPSFVEFLFYRIGSEVRDRPFHLETLILSSNSITKLASIQPYLVFLPTLHFLILTENQITDRNEVVIDSRIQVIFDEVVANENANDNWGWEGGTETSTTSASTSAAPSEAPRNTVERPAPLVVPMQMHTLTAEESSEFARAMENAEVYS